MTRIVEPAPAELIGARLREWPSPERKRALMDRAVDRWHGDDRGMVELARALLVVEPDGATSGLAELNRVAAAYAGSSRVAQCASTVAAYFR